ncbi:uncharacterized protein LOC111624269 [Centruroides sculpturatus]|uniref:uncharacterized protein LOC111624269 n=2 Tax=Centruroides sculpturatus TaxID=218467 RepID=UPI000C6D46BD|nr:uncharacterized protein LOC111624269 [Centruroides sculpturatus]
MNGSAAKSTTGTGSPPPGGNAAANVTVSSNSTKPLLDVSRTITRPASLAAVSRRSLVEEQVEKGIYQMLASLALLCLLSLLMSFLALFFLQKVASSLVSPEDFKKNGEKKIVVNPKEYFAVYQVSVALCTLTLCLNLCCLFVCCIQFLFAIKLMKIPRGNERTNKFLKRSSQTRIVAISGFFLSIPIFFTGVILFTFIHFHEVPAIITSIIIGSGVVFCGVTSVQNVYLWQWEKTRALEELVESKLSHFGESNEMTTPGAIELSTLV